ncbi:Wadjet anti-phage system protein JetA family protein [Stenotrophomonas geniculata]|uniref:Wadjet anti-phage system protein JetA family protein n=1 Tax=Stenotrophomonas geniculata TaxID=86188 RepID=UPI002E779186|nr:Wadjet anti-phage system protein JetA family protein [Stenotrophomonas geniculata]
MAIYDLTDQIFLEKIAERYPPLFKRLPDRLFAPLASANRQQYWSLLCVLHAKRFGPEAPLPPSSGFLTREITADISEELQYQDWTPEGDDVTPATPLAIRAIMVFNRLRDAGWLRVDRVGVREMVTMAPAVAHFMSRLVEFAHTGPEFVSGKIRSIEANLKLLFDDATDGSSLQEAARQSRALLEHVRIAGTNVRDLMLELGRVDATGEFVRRFFDDYVERMFIGDYKELRTREHPLARRQEILRLVAHVQQTPAMRARLIQWYLEKQAGRDPTRAEALFERDIEKVEDLRRIDEYLDRLDDEIRRANKLALAYLDYRLRATRPLDELIHQAIDAVIKHGSQATALTPFAPGDCLAGERLASPRLETKRPPPSGLRQQVMSPEQAARARLALMARDRRTMSLPKLAAFVRLQLGEADTVASATLRIDSIEAVRALQTLCTISTANASTSKLLRANARAMSSGFTTIRLEGEQDEHQGISHLPFVIARTTKPAKGGDA